MSDEIIPIEETPTTSVPSVPIPEIIDPVCSVCGFPLHVIRSGPSPKLNADGTLSVSDIAILGCFNTNFNNLPCPMVGQEQSRNETLLNLFKG
jgi:hypothetical protein